MTITDRLRSITARGVPGIAVAIAGADGLRETAAAGYADLASGVPASADMVCPWFSMTKIVTASLVMRLAGRGLLDLDRPILPLVPELAVVQPRALVARITPRHLLSHSAGFANPVPVRWIHPADRPGPDPEALLKGLLAKHYKLRFEPGARSSYSNLGTPCFTAPTFTTFVLLVAGLAGVWHHSRAHRFSAAGRWSADEVGLVVLRLVIGWLIPVGAPVLVAAAGTMFRRTGPQGACRALGVWRVAAGTRGRILARSYRSP